MKLSSLEGKANLSSFSPTNNDDTQAKHTSSELQAQEHCCGAGPVFLRLEGQKGEGLSWSKINEEGKTNTSLGGRKCCLLHGPVMLEAVGVNKKKDPCECIVKIEAAVEG
ncbi:Receptor-Transporting Protein 4 [Manis pentadactyla]|nr:Receptor-Transporting Protein 4 [Manis pentadactyla]